MAEGGRISKLLALNDQGLEFALLAVTPYHVVLQSHLSWAANPGSFNCTCAACVFKLLFMGNTRKGQQEIVVLQVFVAGCAALTLSREQPSSRSRQPIIQGKKGSPILQAVAAVTFPIQSYVK